MEFWILIHNIYDKHLIKLHCINISEQHYVNNHDVAVSLEYNTKMLCCIYHMSM